MTHLLIKCFVKDPDQLSSFSVREAYGKLSSIVGIIINVILSLSKIGIGLIFGSMAVLADGINNLSDAASSIITLVGFKLASKPADTDHPYGHARIEYVSGLIVSFIILFLGMQLIISSFDKILHPDVVNYSFLMIITLIFSIVMKLWLYLFNRSIGKRIDSTTILATAADSFNDVLATSGVLITSLIAKYTTLQLDGYVGILVGLFVCYSGITLVRETMNPLLGEAPDPAFIREVEDKLLSYEVVKGFHDLVLHSYGPNRYFASVHIEVPADSNLLECHDMIDNIERDFSNQLGINLVIHLDPIITDDENSLAIKSVLIEVLKNIDPLLTFHDFRLVCGPTHTNILFDIALPVGFKIAPLELADRIDSEMKKIDPNYYTIITIDTDYISTSIHANAR